MRGVVTLGSYDIHGINRICGTRYSKFDITRKLICISFKLILHIKLQSIQANQCQYYIFDSKKDYNKVLIINLRPSCHVKKLSHCTIFLTDTSNLLVAYSIIQICNDIRFIVLNCKENIT